MVICKFCRRRLNKDDVIRFIEYNWIGDELIEERRYLMCIFCGGILIEKLLSS